MFLFLGIVSHGAEANKPNMEICGLQTHGLKKRPRKHAGLTVMTSFSHRFKSQQLLKETAAPLIDESGENDSAASLHLATFMSNLLFSKQLTSKIVGHKQMIWPELRHPSNGGGRCFIYPDALAPSLTFSGDEGRRAFRCLMDPASESYHKLGNCLFTVGNTLVIDISLCWTGTDLFDRDLQ